MSKLLTESDVFPWAERTLRRLAFNQLFPYPSRLRLVGRLLGVLAESDDPAGVERAVDVVMAAVDVQGVLGERAGRDLEHHRRTLARRVVVLLDAVDDALTGRVVDDAFAAHRVRDGAALGRVLTLGLHRDGVAAEDVQFAFRERLLIELSALGRRRDGIEHTGVADARFGVIGDELVAVGRHPDPGVPWSHSHSKPSSLLLEFDVADPRARRVVQDIDAGSSI